MSTVETSAVDNATVRDFRVPGVGRVRVEIGDSVRTGYLGHSYPRYRVVVNGVTVMAGEDIGVPCHQAVDSMDAALSLLAWAVFEQDRSDDPAEWTEVLERWLRDRGELRAAITAPGVYWRDGVERWKADRGL